MAYWYYDGHKLCVRVIDLGVMTPCEKILETAVREKAGMFFFIFFFQCKQHLNHQLLIEPGDQLSSLWMINIAAIRFMLTDCLSTTVATDFPIST